MKRILLMLTVLFATALSSCSKDDTSLDGTKWVYDSSLDPNHDPGSWGSWHDASYVFHETTYYKTARSGSAVSASPHTKETGTYTYSPPNVSMRDSNGNERNAVVSGQVLTDSNSKAHKLVEE